MTDQIKRISKLSYVEPKKVKGSPIYCAQLRNDCVTRYIQKALLFENQKTASTVYGSGESASQQAGTSN
jgi:hypothetical protein